MLGSYRTEDPTIRGPSLLALAFRVFAAYRDASNGSVAARAVGVAVGELFGGGVAHGADRHLEV